MELMTLDETRSLLTRAASLRGQGRQREAIDLIERNLPQLNDDLRLISTVEQVRAASVLILQRVRRGSELLAEGRITAAFLTPDGRPTRQPREWVQTFERIRRGENAISD